MPYVSCPNCGHTWESRAASGRTRCGSCGKAVSVPAAAGRWEPDEPATTGESPASGLGLFAVVLCIAGALMLNHARTADPAQQPPEYRSWKWVAGGIVCLGSGVGLGWLAVQSALDS
jgi:hypothetical protein